MLKLTATPPPSFELESLGRISGLQEIMAGHRDLARTGTLSGDDFEDFVKSAEAHGFRIVLVWDTLASDTTITRGGELLERLDVHRFNAIRVRDPGIVLYLQDRYPRIPIHLILETGNHNRVGILAWIERLKPERVIVSNELPLKLISGIRADARTDFEIQALGRIPIFYSPRGLISYLDRETKDSEWIQKNIVSESDLKRFPVVETRHGTLMYYEKDLFLLPYLGEIERAGIDYARLDLQHYRSEGLVAAIADYLNQPDGDRLGLLKSLLPPKLTRGFFKSNRTDKQFVKLKNPHLQNIGSEDLIGIVLETLKKKYIAIEARDNLQVGDRVCFVIPEGDRINHRVRWIRDFAGNTVTETARPGLWLIDPVSRISPGTRVFRQNPSGEAG